MKRFFEFICLSIFFLSIFSACRAEPDAFFEKTIDKKVSVQVITENDSVCFSDGRESRTIMPDGFSSSDLDFYLYGIDLRTNQNVFETAERVTFHASEESDRKGTIDLYLPSSYYEFYLAAVPSGSTFNWRLPKVNTVLIGSTIVDLNYESEVLFRLSSKRLNAMSGIYGNVELSLYTKNWEMSSHSGYYLNVMIQTRDLSQTLVSSQIYTTLPVDLPAASNYHENNLSPGQYNFIACFTDGVHSFYWSDVLEIEANRTISKSLIIPNVIELPPNAPSDFVCGYIDPTNNTDSHYPVEFKWTDNSNNEAYFQLELLDVSSVYSGSVNEPYITDILGLTNVYTSAPTNYTKDNEWNTLRLSYPEMIFTDSYFYNTEACLSGSLIKNSDYITLLLPLGRRYIARICTVNDAGYSSYAYADIYNGSDFNYDSSHMTTWNEAEGEAGINRFRVSYDFSGGKFYDDEDLANDVYTEVHPSYQKSYIRSFVSTPSGMPINLFENYEYDEVNHKTCSLCFPDNSEGSLVYKPLVSWKRNDTDFSGDYVYCYNLSLKAAYEGNPVLEIPALTVHCDCDTTYSADFFIFEGNRPAIMTSHPISICMNSSDCPFSASCDCENTFTVQKSSLKGEASYIYIMLKNPGNTKFDSATLFTVLPGASSSYYEYTSSVVGFSYIEQGVEHQTMNNYIIFTINVDDLSTGTNFYMLSAHNAEYDVNMNLSQYFTVEE